jgi:magnesium-transporting ATPase (P-type)
MSLMINQPCRLTPPATPADWHALDRQSVLAALDTYESGLPHAEASSRLNACGANILPLRRQTTAWQILLRQCLSPIFYILGLAALVSIALGDVTDAAFIAIVVGINVAVGGYQEWRAERSMRALQRLLTLRAAVERDGEVYEVNAETLVPGNIVWLEPGARVPADVWLLSAHGLEVDESLLTGESLPVDKDPGWVGEASAPVADRLNMSYAGSIVFRGRGKGVVVATGTATNVGQLALDLLGATAGKPPLLLRMERFNHAVTMGVILAAVAVGLIGILGHGYPVSQMFFFAVALAVASIPEGLPAALSIATHRMARRGVIVRRLAAVERLGSCTLIASDKTGTLTCNELTVREVRLASGEVFEVTGEGYSPNGRVLFEARPFEPSSHVALNDLARAAVLCNEADLHPQDGGWVWRGDPTDIALLSLAHKLGWNREATLDLHPQVNEIPFEPEHRFAATYHATDAAVRVFVKGTPERVLAMCTAQADPAALRTWHEVAEAMAGRGYRVLALAEGSAPEGLDPSGVPPQPSRLTFLGLAGMIDPLRPGVRNAVAACHTAGITVCMVTGDHPVTALAIARDLGMATRQDQVVTGHELDAPSSMTISVEKTPPRGK